MFNFGWWNKEDTDVTSIDMISTTARGPGPDYEDDDHYLYEDGEYSQNANAAESHSFHG